MFSEAETTRPVVIFHIDDSFPNYFASENVYKASYARFAALADAKNIDLRFVTGVENYSHGHFLSCWKYIGSEFTQIHESFSASMVLLKARTSLLDAEVRVNTPHLEKVCRDKYLTYQTYPELVKKTVLFDPESAESLAGEAVVVKPRYGAEGHNVQLVKKAQLNSISKSHEGLIAQEVIDSSQGIPGLVDSRHELRLYVFNGQLQSAYLRIPAKDSFLTNISQGATVKLMKRSEIPNSAFEVTKIIDAQFSQNAPRMYTIDLMYENGRPWVVELNDMPGMPDVSVQPLADEFFNDLLDVLHNGTTDPRLS